jgi:WD40 repeat protein
MQRMIIVPGKIFLAEEAWKLDRNKTVTGTIYQIFRENRFYKIAAKHKKVVCSVAFLPDGKTILTGSMDKTARLWKITSLEEFLKKGNCEQLSEEQKKEYGIEDSTLDKPGCLHYD